MGFAVNRLVRDTVYLCGRKLFSSVKWIKSRLAHRVTMEVNAPTEVSYYDGSVSVYITLRTSPSKLLCFDFFSYKMMHLSSYCIMKIMNYLQVNHNHGNLGPIQVGFAFWRNFK